MSNSSVCAVLVTFESDPDSLRAVLRAILPQVQKLVVVENGSAEPRRARILEEVSTVASSEPSWHSKLTLIQGNENVGLAKAFNRAIAAVGHGETDYFLFLDHDSVVEEDAVRKLVESAEALQPRFKVGAVGAFNVEAAKLPLDDFFDGYLERTGYLVDLPVRETVLLINSGLLVSSEVFDVVGRFDETYFIDAIDFEFSLRLVSRGYRLFRVESSRIRHTRGKFEVIRIGSWTWAYHQPAVWREYFVARDTLRTAIRYSRKVPFTSLLIFIMPVREAFMSALFYGQPLRRLWLLAAGAVRSVV